jgi:hypothetical protein
MAEFSFSWRSGKSEGAAPEAAGPPAAKPVDTTEAMKLIKEAWADANDPLADPTISANKKAWVGGAVRIYSVLTGEDADAVLRGLNGSTSEGAGIPARYAGMVGQVAPVKRERPRPHPGAQRPVPLDDSGAPIPMDPQVTATSLVSRPAE